MEVKITKLKDNRFKNNHPNSINENYSYKGVLKHAPLTGFSCIVGGFHTSEITKIIEKTDLKCIFETLNSTYLLEYEVI